MGGKKMFICDTCGKLFENPLKMRDHDVCPNCGSMEISKAEKCNKCGEHYHASNIKHYEENDTNLCPECLCLAKRRLSPQEEYKLNEFLRGWDEYVA